MWIKSCNYMELEEYQSVDRIGRVRKAQYSMFYIR